MDPMRSVTKYIFAEIIQELFLKAYMRQKPMKRQNKESISHELPQSYSHTRKDNYAPVPLCFVQKSEFLSDIYIITISYILHKMLRRIVLSSHL